MFSAYCGTAWRICAFVSGRLVLSRQMTRLSRRSVFALDMGSLPDADAIGRADRGGAGRTEPPMSGGYARAMTTQVLWRSGHVLSVARSWSAVRELVVELDAPLGVNAALPSAGAVEPEQRTVLALAYLPLVGAPEVGDRVLLTVGALARGLGTGGYAMVAALPDRLPADPPPATGHLVKAPLHAAAGDGAGRRRAGLPAPRRAPRRGRPGRAARRRRRPALRAAGGGGRHPRVEPAARVVYVLTDGGALPAWFSRSLAALREAGWVAGSVSVGQAFGGDAEAVTVHSGLLAARHVLGADVVVVAQGPGNLGTGTRWGFSGRGVRRGRERRGHAGRSAVASLRVSEADPRPRHRGVSHHSMTAYGRVALLPADVVVPGLPESSAPTSWRRPGALRTARPAPSGRAARGRADGRAARLPGHVVDHGPSAGRRRAGLPGGGRRRPLRRDPGRRCARQQA